MLRKEAEIKWIEQARNSFEAIKKAIMEAPTLISQTIPRDSTFSPLLPMTQ